ncbi:MAG: archease [Nitrospirae bacterium YQR-1]
MDAVEFLDVSGDIGLRVTAANMAELFVKAACAFSSLTTDFDKIEAADTMEIILTAESTSDLIVAWLNELIYNFDTNGFLCKEIIIKEFSQTHISATVKGETFDENRHEKGFLIKAATYHGLKIESGESFSSLEIILDI